MHACPATGHTTSWNMLMWDVPCRPYCSLSLYNDGASIGSGEEERTAPACVAKCCLLHSPPLASTRAFATLTPSDTGTTQQGDCR